MIRLASLMILINFLIPGSLRAENYPNWEGYPPMFSIRDIIEFKGCVYATTKGGLLRYDPSTGEYKRFYQDRGLVNNNVICIGATSQTIYLGFEENGLWSFDPDTETFEQILFPEYHVKTTINKNGIAVLSIFAQNDSILYIGHKNGLDRLNLHTEELRTYTNLGPKISESTQVNEVKIFSGKIWACTSLGLAVADEDNPNLEFAENWKNYTYGSTSITSIIHVVDSYEDAIYMGTNSKGILFYDEKTDTIKQTVVMSTYIFKMAQGLGGYWAASDDGLFTKEGVLWKMAENSKTFLTALVEGEDNKLWIGTMYNGLQCYTDSGYVYTPPESNLKSTTFYDIDIAPNNVIWAATTYRDTDPNSVFQRFQNNTWTAYGNSDLYWFSYIVSAHVDRQGLVWAAIWGSKHSGIIIIQDDGTPRKDKDTFIAVDPEQNIFRSTIREHYVVCSDITEDKHGNIWVANYQEDPPDHRVEAVPSSGAVVVDGYPITRYQHYSPANDGLPTSVIFKICADEDGWVWLGTYNKGVTGIYVGDDPFDKSDTVVRVLTLEHGLNDMKIDALAYDHEGYVWVGTAAGLNRIEKRSNYNLIIENMNQALENVDRDVHAIEVDRFNNKWIGTSGGLVKLNPKNEREAMYTTQNSGLFSDIILSLKYDNTNDILWVGTGTGLNKFHVFGREETQTTSEFYVYPNPFEIWGYDSNTVFTNLKSGSSVRIFTFTGVLINELAAKETTQNESSMVIWNGRNFEGEYVGSGVYFFTGINSRGDTFRDKLVVVRR